MPLAIAGATQTQLDAGRIISRGMVLFDLPSGLWGFWTGVGLFNYNAVDYVGAGSLITLDDLEETADGSATSFVLKLTSIPNSDLTPDRLNTIEDEAYHLRPVTIMTAYFHPDTKGLLSVETEIRGYVDFIQHIDKVGGEKVLLGYCESKALDNQKAGYRSRNDADQRLIDANDRGLKFAHNAHVQHIYWGRNPPQAHPRPSNKTKYGNKGKKG